MRALIDRFRAFQHASLLRRTVVSVAAFTMLACTSIATLSYAAVSATKAVFSPSAPAASASPSAGPVAPPGRLAAGTTPKAPLAGGE